MGRLSRICRPSRGDKLTGKQKASLIQQGEKNLTYPWKLITATDYLAFGRTGSREPHDETINVNSMALRRLVLAELAEGNTGLLPAAAGKRPPETGSGRSPDDAVGR